VRFTWASVGKTAARVIALAWAVTVVTPSTLRAQEVETVHQFPIPCTGFICPPPPPDIGREGQDPRSLIEASDGNFYGATSLAAFRVTAAGDFRILELVPPGFVVQSRDGNLYVSTFINTSDPADGGSIVRASLDGATVTSIHHLDPAVDGREPSRLVEARDGSLYGRTVSGGAFDAGTLFKVGTDGTFTVLRSFDQFESISPVVAAADGNVYGFSRGIANANGSVVRITPGGAVTTVLQFDPAANGLSGSGSALIEALDGSLIGAASPSLMCSSIFRLASNGAVTIVNRLTGPIDRCIVSGLLRSSDGLVYGYWGLMGRGLFQMAPDGQVQALADPGGGVNFPQVTALIHGRDGNLYGSLVRGNATSSGSVFRVRIHPSCDDAMSAAVDHGVLRLGFTVATSTPAAWTAFLFSGDGTTPLSTTPLWLAPLPAIAPTYVSVPIANVPTGGTFGVATVLRNQGGATCADWKFLESR